MIETALLVFLILYAHLIIFFIYSSLIYPRKESNADIVTLPVSIVIPYKNEAENLPSLIACIREQDYPSAIEVVFVDDGSDDGSAEIIEQVRAESPLPIRLLNNRFDKGRLLTSKQQALDLGIREAAHPLIALTDADMTLDKQWLYSLASSLRPGSDLVFGHTAIFPGNSFFSVFQSFQLAFLFSIAAVFHYCGIVGSCMGNNLLLRKTAYLECGGYAAIGYSITEDRALLRHFRRCRRTTDIVTPFFPTAYTAPHHSVHIFIQQIRRWTRGGFRNGINLFMAGFVFTLQNTILVTGAAGFFSLRISLCALINFFLTWSLLLITFKKNRSPVSALLFPVYFILLLIETMVVLPAVLFKKEIIWKGRPV